MNASLNIKFFLIILKSSTNIFYLFVLIQAFWNEYTSSSYKQQKLAQTTFCNRQQSPIPWI